MLSIEPPLIRSSNRLEAYSDALFSIIATVMILPVSHTELPEDESLGTSFVQEILPQIGVYIFTFLIVSFYWTVHVGLYESLENVDEFMVLLNLAIMMVVTFFPFTFTLLGLYPLNSLAMVLFFLPIILISLLQIVFIVHAFRTPGMLKLELRDADSRKTKRNQMLVEICTPLVFAFAALIFAYIIPILSGICLILMVFAPMIRVSLAKCYAKIRTSSDPEMPAYVSQRPRMRERMMSETVTKERIEFFSDGVFAIVATLIILDICENNIPSDDMVSEYGSLEAALNHFSPMYLAYAGTFCTVALQWYVHHSLLHYLKELNRLMLWFNQLGLLCIGLTPLAFKLTSSFDRHKYENNETIALQLNCLVIFLASMFQAAIWVVACFNQERRLMPSGYHHGDDHGYVTAKLSVFPLLTLLVYWLTVFLENLSVTAFVCMQFSTIALFILLGLLFKHIRLTRSNTPSDSEEYNYASTTRRIRPHRSKSWRVRSSVSYSVAICKLHRLSMETPYQRIYTGRAEPLLVESSGGEQSASSNAERQLETSAEVQ